MEQILFSPLSYYIFSSISFSNFERTTPKVIKDLIKIEPIPYILVFFSVFTVTKDLKIALVYVSILYIINNIYKEEFQEFEIRPGCYDATVSDLLELYDNDPVKLRKAIYTMGVPLSVDITEENAPYIASFIVDNKK
jgi:flagellar biosynthesis protein FlhB